MYVISTPMLLAWYYNMVVKIWKLNLTSNIYLNSYNKPLTIPWRLAVPS